jgi:hypothetical protein
MRRHTLRIMIGILLIAPLLTCTQQTPRNQKDKRLTQPVSQGEQLYPLSIIDSDYGYLYKIGEEDLRYGLYSYVLFSPSSSDSARKRRERFLEELFDSTFTIPPDNGFNNDDFAKRNIIYLPTKQNKISDLNRIISGGSAPPAMEFAAEFYDYDRVNIFFHRICTKPPETILNFCMSGLSRGGPYLFTFPYPISTLTEIPPPFLFGDFSKFDERAFGELITVYKKRLKREEVFKKDFFELVENLYLRLLNFMIQINQATNEILFMVISD